MTFKDNENPGVDPTMLLTSEQKEEIVEEFNERIQSVRARLLDLGRAFDASESFLSGEFDRQLALSIAKFLEDNGLNWQHPLDLPNQDIETREIFSEDKDGNLDGESVVNLVGSYSVSLLEDTVRNYQEDSRFSAHFHPNFLVSTPKTAKIWATTPEHAEFLKYLKRGDSAPAEYDILTAKLQNKLMTTAAQADPSFEKIFEFAQKNNLSCSFLDLVGYYKAKSENPDEALIDSAYNFINRFSSPSKMIPEYSKLAELLGRVYSFISLIGQARIMYLANKLQQGNVPGLHKHKAEEGSYYIADDSYQFSQEDAEAAKEKYLSWMNLEDKPEEGEENGN